MNDGTLYLNIIVDASRYEKALALWKRWFEWLRP